MATGSVGGNHRDTVVTVGVVAGLAEAEPPAAIYMPAAQYSVARGGGASWVSGSR
jgi:hypothetical protein